MSFLVDDQQLDRHDKIRKFLSEGENVIAVLLAATDFEWTLRRAIIALGKSPNVVIRTKILNRCSGLENYKMAWKEEVKCSDAEGLPDVIPKWGQFQKAYLLRHTLAHGIIDKTGKKYAEDRVNLILNASTAIAKFAHEKDIDLFARLPVRRRSTKK